MMCCEDVVWVTIDINLLLIDHNGIHFHIVTDDHQAAVYVSKAKQERECRGAVV